MAEPNDKGSFDILRTQAYNQLKDILQHAKDTRLFFEDSLKGSIQYVMDPKELKGYTVKGSLEVLTYKDTKLPKAPVAKGKKGKQDRNTRTDTRWQSYVYIVRPTIRTMNMLASHIESAQLSCPAGFEFHVVFVPRDTLFAQEVLTERGVWDIVRPHCLDIGFLPLRHDFLSLDNPGSFRECTLYNDETSIFHIVLAIIKVQILFGRIPSIKAKGRFAMRLVENLNRETAACSEIATHPTIDELIVIDRSCDLVSPLLTQLTYEGMLDELFGIHLQSMQVSNKIVKYKEKGPEDTVTMDLYHKISLFHDFAYLAFNDLPAEIQRQAKIIQEAYDRRNQVDTVKEVKEYVKSFKVHQKNHHDLQIHMNLASAIGSVTMSAAFHQRLDLEHAAVVDGTVDFGILEDMIASVQPLRDVMRLLCLISVTRGGIKQKRLDQLQALIQQAYGYEALFTITNLRRAGLLNVGGKSWYDRVRKQLDLGPRSIDDHSAKQADYVFSGLYPLSIRAVERLSAAPDVAALEEKALRAVPGGGVTQFGEPTSRAAGRRKKTMVLFLGGVCAAEVAALRHLTETGDVDYITATTAMTNGAGLVESLFQDLDKPMAPGHTR
ncbi:Sec1-like protein [Carpediemonas membranifera]|uniref:Sec1-like protein n=1 Tax=Carpediemonas membranifera TaxID=201153 RepID=A0A8J6B6X5_9EUKA|nr:Sec1-like protein [Carpediemonas membranifera]|eukprot:KAG9396933.1 Sec1-like protein [Carpediemonas membranifera]